MLFRSIRVRAHTLPSSSPCDLSTTRLTACILDFDRPLTSRPMEWRTLSQRPSFGVVWASVGQRIPLLCVSKKILNRLVADVWAKSVWDFQAQSFCKHRTKSSRSDLRLYWANPLSDPRDCKETASRSWALAIWARSRGTFFACHPSLPMATPRDICPDVRPATTLRILEKAVPVSWMFFLRSCGFGGFVALSFCSLRRCARTI